MPTDEQRRACAEAKARAEAAHPDAMTIFLLGEPLPAEVTAVAEVLGLDPGVLGWHVEAEHGHEPHDEGYEESVWRTAECTGPGHLLTAEHWGKRARDPHDQPPARPARQVRVQPRRKRKRGR